MRGDQFTVFCGGCMEPVEACAGRDADWMHTGTRREACPAGGWARPETDGQQGFRLAEYERSYRTAS